MQFTKHLELKGYHAFLSPSTYHWIRYDDDKFDITYRTKMAASLGDRLHEIASELIKMKIRLPRSEKTLNSFVNDAIGFHMESETILFYSENCFGTADAISFKKNLLRVHDLKTGVTRTSMDQLMVYAALFCLEYDVRPGSIEMELRIYKMDAIEVLIPDVDAIVHIMDKIISFDRRINELKAENTDD